MKKTHVWRWAHYATHAKKRRTRKKYQKKLQEHFVNYIPPGVDVKVSLIPGPNGYWWSRTPYAVAIDYWPQFEPSELKMEVVY